MTVALAERYDTVLASDIHFDLICMWRELQAGWEPPENVSEKSWAFWRAVEPLTHEESALKAFIGYGCSFGGKYYGGYARRRNSRRNDAAESKRNALKQIKSLQDVTFEWGDYQAITQRAMPGDLIYCDPPYEGTTEYKTGDFEHKRFWEWANRLADNGVMMYISEYQAPEGWTEVWSKKQKLQVKLNDGKPRATRVERLFTREVG